MFITTCAFLGVYYHLTFLVSVCRIAYFLGSINGFTLFTLLVRLQLVSLGPLITNHHLGVLLLFLGFLLGLGFGSYGIRAVARTLIGGVYINIFRFCPTSFF